MIMLNEEKYIFEKIGKKSPFTLPEGYFESLTDRVMSNLPELEATETIPLHKKPNWWLWGSAAAACIAVAFVGLQLIHTPNDTAGSMEASNTTDGISLEEQYQTDMMNYAMIDGEDIYCYLSGEGY